jgi:2-C-methyl-D-erythritol 4-phosphate cytidylyltransferase
VIDSRTDLVLIHDAVRPFICREDVSKVIRVAERYGAAILGVPVKATIKKATCLAPASPAGRQATSEVIVEKTLDRNRLWEVQTPQVFRTDIILKAYEKFGNIDATDDAFLAEKLGITVRVVMGSYFNIKITTPEDLIIAQAISKTL